MNRILLFILLNMCSFSLIAQHKIRVLDAKDSTLLLEPAQFDLQEVTVSGTRSRLQEENVINVERLNLIANSELQGISLAQKLASVAGLSNFSTGAGIGKPAIRGLSGNRIAVFAQGVRLENQQWGDEHGLGLDENGYEQVEIIKGPASLLYGSDALGGVLHFNDERFADENSEEARLQSEYNGNSSGWRNSAGFKVSSNRFHANAFGAFTTHNDYSDGNGNAVYNSRFNTLNFKTALAYTGSSFNTSLKYSVLREKYGLSGEDDDAISTTRRPDAPYQDMTTHLISTESGVYFDNNSKLKVDIGYTFNKRLEYEELNEAALNMNLGTASYNVRWYSPLRNEHWTLTAGSQGMYQTNRNHGEEQLIPDAQTIDGGLFAMTNYHFDKNSVWQTGIRFDARNIDGGDLKRTYSAINFSTGISAPIFEKISLRAGLSSGFRAPTMFELLSDGVHEGVNRYETGDKNLKTENSYQADIALKYTVQHLELFVNPYFNYIRHFIHLQPTGEEREEKPVYHYTQSDALLFGGEAGFHLHPHPFDWIHIEGSYSSVYGQTINSEYLALMPSTKLNLTVRTNISRKFSVWIHDQYSFAQNRVAEYETPTPAYNLINSGASFESKLLTISVVANNLLNEAYYDHLSRYKENGILNIGRNVSFRLQIEF
ncbi:MAG: TonB-dependent receptor [Dysgonamonadaceae bacterium]|jgi:iron complex outermembrane receptor protein|nr:TonB-dependent receptor [Dysgonamonadaceae bacterium]